MHKFIRTQSDFKKLIFEIKTAARPYKAIISQKEAERIFLRTSDCMGPIECAEIAANGGYEIEEEATVIFASTH